MSQEKTGQRIWVASLWRRKSKRDGTEYFGGTWGGARILIFSNAHKRTTKSPDYNMYIADGPKPTTSDASDSTVAAPAVSGRT